MKNFSDKIANKIKKENIKPKSKLVFLLKDYFIWSIFGVAIVIGGLAFVVMLFLLTSNDWDIHQHLDKSFWEYLLISLPYFWISILVLFLLLAYYNYRHTKEGYRYKTYLIVFGSVIMSIVIGTGLFFLGMGNKIEQIFADNLPYYNNFTQHRIEMWNQPEKGLLAGEIIEFNDDVLKLKDFKKNIWKINTSDASWRGGKVAQLGEQIKIIGAKQSESEFTAQEIRSWVGRHNNGQYNNTQHSGRRNGGGTGRVQR